jgi:acetyl-CoA acetyltransferase
VPPPTRRRRSYDGAALVAPVSFGYAKSSPHEVPWFIGGALQELLVRSGETKAAVDALMIASYRLAPDNAASVCEYLGLSPGLIMDLPYGGASGVMALQRAARAVESGDAEIVACIGADIVPRPGDDGSNFSTFSRDHVFPYGAAGPNGVFSLITAAYTHRWGVQREDFARICIAQRHNARAAQGGALLQGSLTLEDYLEARPITGDLSLLDCVMRCCGAEGFLVMSVERARASGLPYARLAAVVERHNGSHDDPIQGLLALAADRDALYEQAGLGPHDMGFVQAYDDYPVIVMLQLEALGFCAPGQARQLVREQDLRVEGSFPLNTSGGMLSNGQAGAAGGFLGVVEALRQVTGDTPGARVRRPQAGMVIGYGTVNYDRGLCTAAAILTQPGS